MKVCVEQQLHCGVAAIIDLPEGKTWDDVHDWYVKWDSLFIRFNVGTAYTEIPLESDNMDIIDWKRPIAARVYSANEKGDVDYSNELSEYQP